MKKLIIMTMAILLSFNILSFAKENFKYNMISEEEYNKEIWDSFYSLFPDIANEEKTELKEGLNKEFLPYYSMTMNDYEEGNIFGGWEITEADEENDSIISHGVYAYGSIDDKEDLRWHRLTETDASPFYGSFYKHNLSAEVVGTNTVRIHIDVDMTDSCGGKSGKCNYQLSPDGEANGYSNALKNPWLAMKDNVSAYKGSVTTHSFSSTSSSSPNERRLKFTGYWDISGNDLVKFRELCPGNQIHWGAGFKEEGHYSMSRGTQECKNLVSSIDKALCSHAQKRYEQVSGDEINHNIICTKCGRNLGKEKHGQKNEFSRCPTCSYQFNVSGNVVCQYNGYTKNIEYSLKPGMYFEPPKTTGYITPQKVLIPEKGGDINIVYEPIRYRIILDDKVAELKYDETYILDRINKKGMIHEAYIVD